MNKIFAPKLTFKNITPDEDRICNAYSKIFNIAVRNIVERKRLTKELSLKYTNIQDGKRVFNN